MLNRPLPLIFLLVFAFAEKLSSQTALYISLDDALQLALQNAPALQSRAWEVESARKGIAMAEQTSRPSVDIGYHLNMATYNNVTGMFLPGDFLPVSGPPSTENEPAPVPGSALTLLAKWQPITFGQRSAQVRLAEAGLSEKNALRETEVFTHQVELAHTYLDAVFAGEIAEVYRQNIQRWEFSLQQSRALTRSGIRPGTDTALVRANLSKSRIDWLKAVQQYELLQLQLAELLAVAGAVAPADTAFLLRLPMDVFAAPPPVSPAHPSLLPGLAEVESARLREDWLHKTTYPTVGFWGNAYLRGSGVLADGSRDFSKGILPDKYNYSVGVQVTFPLLRHFDVRLQTDQEKMNENAAIERLRDRQIHLNRQSESARVQFARSRAVAAETPVQNEAAHFAFDALKSRYDAGLADFSDYLQAQYNVLLAETDQKRARWETWKSLLNFAAAQGDLTIFLNQFKG